MRRWEDLPQEMKNEEVRFYYDLLCKKKWSLRLKRIFDIVVSIIMLVCLSWLFFILAIAIKLDSPGPVFYRQERITQYGRKFKIHKFRTMVNNADKKGSLVTVKNDSRVTRVGRIIRKYRLDEICQLLDILSGNMTYVGTRPEVEKYVKEYSPEMMSTLLLPAGVTNLTCIYYKNEEELLEGSLNPDKTYIEEILPEKMKWNLKEIKEFSFWSDIKVMFMTFFAVCGKEYKENIENKKVVRKVQK